MGRGPLIAVAVVIVMGSYLLFRGSSDAFDWSHDWPAAVEKARAEGKPILLLFGGPW